MGRLTVRKVWAAKEPGMYGDGDTLYLRIAKGGSKSWIQRLLIDGRRHDIGLGGIDLTTLAEARELAHDNRRLVRRGGNPLSERRQRNAVPSFEQALRLTHESMAATFTSAKHAEQWLTSVERHLGTVLAMPVDKITTRDLVSALAPIWTTKAATARKVRQRVRKVLDWCHGNGHVSANVAGDGLDAALGPQPTKAKHHPFLPFDEVSAAMQAVCESGAALSTKLAFKMLVLTATRSGEVRNAVWAEFDLDAEEWRIPAARMKAKVEHRIPLSSVAIDVLREAHTLRDVSDLVFPAPSRAGRPISDATMSKLLRDIGYARERCSIHGMRSSFRTWASERTDADHAVMELSLAHAVGSNVERAYNRTDLLGKRRALMESWARFVTQEQARVLEPAFSSAA